MTRNSPIDTRTRVAVVAVAVAALAAVVAMFAAHGQRGASPLSSGPASPVAASDHGRASLAGTVQRLDPTADRSGPLPSVGALPIAASDTPAATAAAPRGRIYGRALGPDGQPAASRKVRVLRTDLGQSVYPVTDSDGRYDQRDLDAGRYHVSTNPTDEELAALGLTSRFGGLEWLAQTSLELSPGEEAEVDLGALPERPIRVTGRLVGAPGGATALLQWAPEGEFGYDLARYVETAADGTYEVVLASPGAYHLSAIVKSPPSPSTTRVDSGVSVPDLPACVHDIAVPPGRAVVTVTAAGAPLRNARVELTPRAGVPPVPAMSATTFGQSTNAEGRTEFHSLQPGLYGVAVHISRREGEPQLAAAWQALVVRDSSEPAELAFDLEPGVAPTVRVLGADGAPVANANLFVLDATGEPLNPLQGRRTSKAGEATLPSLGPGRYGLVAALGDQWSNVRRFELAAGAAPPAFELTLGPSGLLLVDRSALASRAWVEVRHEEGWLLAPLLDSNLHSGAYGRSASSTVSRYRLPPGNYIVRAVTASGPRSARTLAVAGRTTHRVALE